MARLKEFYQKTVVPKLKQDLGLKNVMQIPKITKITVNMGVGEAVADRKVMDAAVADLTKITGQKPKLCMSKKSIASFKVRENLAIGQRELGNAQESQQAVEKQSGTATPTGAGKAGEQGAGSKSNMPDMPGMSHKAGKK